MEIVHASVMTEEVLLYLKPREEDSLFLDCTLGEGGHSEVMLSTFPRLRVVGVDADPAILARAKSRLAPFGDRFRGYNAWFDEFFAAYPLEERPDRILFDLGISTFHYVRSGRGFSFQSADPLDMRLSLDLSESAADLLNSREERTLADLFFELGEERYSRKIAAAVVRNRSAKTAWTAKSFAELVWAAVPASYRHGRLHPATRCFQALRIAVNRELDRLDAVLPRALGRLKLGGRMGVIAFHSLEDRRVKLFFREQNKSCICPPEAPMCKCGGKRVVELVTRKAVKPREDEILANSASRSARFRVAEKVSEEGRSL